jgi:DNA polymerase-3 subunit alpha
MGYYQLNTETAFDFGASTVLAEEYAQRAQELGYLGIGIADHSLYAFPSFADACSHHQLTGIFGYRVKLASVGTVPFEAVLYVLSEQGYRNLCQILSRKEETLGTEILAQYHEGLALVIDTEDDNYRQPVFLTAIAPQLLAYSKIFGDDFYLGISIYSEVDANEMSVLYDFCKEREYHSVAFPKASYLRKSDAYQSALLRASLSKEKADSLPESGPYFLLSEKALSAVYREEDLDQTIALAEKAHFTFFQKRGKLITFPDEDKRLEQLSTEGLTKKLGSLIPKEYLNRLSYELSVIRNMHFSSYFLLVSDYVNYARTSGIKVGPGRGSAGGSLVAYALNITEIDPLKFNLSFERFLNPKRKNMPDIDVDFEDSRRDEVIRYLKQRYGENHVSDIVTFVKLKPKSALNLIGPALSFNEIRLKRLTGAISDMADTFEEAKKDSFFGPRLCELLKDPYYQGICEKANALLGIPVNTSIHAAGVILSEGEIYETCPVRNGKDGTVLYEYPNMERMGFLKCDILSLSNLTFIKRIEERIRKAGKTLPDIPADLDNPKVYETLNRGDLADIFQLESPGMKRTLETIHPTSFNDIAATVALYRPGPKAYIGLYAERKQGKTPVTYLDPSLAPVLKDTYGIMLYQEEVMEAVKAVAGFSAEDADLFRRAISKKDLSKMESYSGEFLAGAMKRGISEKTAKDIYQDIERFADYGFNKSHAYAYSLITYTLLYYKTFFPVQFYQTAIEATSLTSKEMYFISKELWERKIKAVTPDINRSEKEEVVFDAAEAVLPFGAVSGVNEKITDAILSERTRNGPFRDFYSFCERLYPVIPLSEEKTIGSLIDAGAFDSLSKARKAMKDHLDEYLGFARMGFAPEKIPVLSAEGEDLGERLYLEKNALGAILSVRLSSLAYVEGYRTLFVSDDSRFEMDHLLLCSSEDQEFQIEVSGKTPVEKNTFVAVQGDFRKKRVRPTGFRVLGKKQLHE